MAKFVFTEEVVRDYVAKYEGDEQISAVAYGIRWPSMWLYALVGGIVAPFFARYYACGAKRSGLVLVELSALGKEKSVRVIPWGEISGVQYKKGLVMDKLLFKTADGQKWNMRFQYLVPFPKNRDNSRLIAQHMESQWAS